MDPGRRRLCQWSGGALIGAAMGGCASSVQLAPGVYNAGSPSRVQQSDVLEERAQDHFFNVCRDAGGLYVVSAYCTHARCVIQFESPSTGAARLGFICSCHGSEFDYGGAVINPPAPRSLDHYRLTFDAYGDMIVDTNTIVDATVRAK
jgi:Rieske Fe-S protein